MFDLKRMKPGAKPLIAVPVMGKTKEELVSEIRDIVPLAPDILEWRGDFLRSGYDINEALTVYKAVKKEAGNIPVLFTIRTAEEGGKLPYDSKGYRDLLSVLIEAGIDLVDIEMERHRETGDEIMAQAKEKHVPVIMSYHDFEKTPGKEEIERRILSMKERGADVAKIAVMSHSAKDTLTVMEALLSVHGKYPDYPVIAIAMGKDGKILRMAGELLGSVMTFASGKEASAPGQIAISDMRRILSILHEE